MILYQLDQNKVLEYKIIRSNKEMTSYKKMVMEKQEPTFYEIKTKSLELVQRIKLGEDIDKGYYFNDSNGFFSILRTEQEEMPTHKKNLSNYIDGYDNHSSCIKISNLRTKPRQQEYVLLTQKSEKHLNYGYYAFSNIWKMPVELAGMTLLEQEKYTEFLEDRRLLETFPAELYQASQINEYDARFLNMQIQGMESMQRVVEAQGKIISKIKTK